MISRILIALIRGYRKWLSPLVRPACRFQPSCSLYALQAIELHGALRGSIYAARRLLRCHPLGRFGHDPVPGSGEQASERIRGRG